MAPRPHDRRTFIARIGLLGAVAGGSVLLPGALAPVSARGADVPLLDAVSRALAELARDTLNGLAVFVVPGPDAYSRAQGTPRDEPGAMEAKTPDFLVESLDNYVPLPDQLATPLGSALANGLADVPIELPDGLPSLPTDSLLDLDEAVRTLLRNDETLPLSLLIALLLNSLAAQVNPAATRGPFLSPFARLSFADKAKAFRQLEEPTAQLVSAIDAELPEPLNGTASGLLQFIAGALLEFSAFGTFCEWSKFDPEKLNVTDTPVGWQLCGYDPGVIDGWDEFHGYYQGREKVCAR